jgi:hypothetical protein
MVNWWRPLLLEQYVAAIIADQEDVGVYFDKRRAERYISYLEKKCEVLYEQVRTHLSFNVVSPYDKPVKPFKADGNYTALTVKWMGGEEESKVVSGPFSRVLFLEPKLDSEKQLKEQLFKLGWKPDEWNYKKDKSGKVIYDENKQPIPTSPKLTESSYDSLTIGIGPTISLYLKASMRLSSIRGWLSRVREDGTIAASANSLGTPTARMRHSGVVNVPKASKSVYFGKQCRSLFRARRGRVLVGHDAKGLEARMEAHETFSINSDYATNLITGDVHTPNAEKWGVSRDIAKSGKYALTYGAYPDKISKTLNISKRKAKEIFDSFWSSDNPLAVLKARLERFWKKYGWIRGLDGRKIYIRKQSDLLNYRFQSDGAIVMKQSMVWLHKRVGKYNIDAVKVIDMHDEAQADVDPGQADLYAALAIQSIREAGKYFNMNVPLDADAKIGANWKDTH